MSGSYWTPDDPGATIVGVTLRISKGDELDLAVDDLLAIQSDIPGLDIERVADEHPDRLTVRWPPLDVDHVVLRAVDVLSAAEASRLVASNPDQAQLVVANQVSADAAAILATDLRWSWLDRRTGLVLQRSERDRGRTREYRFFAPVPEGGLTGHGRSLPGGWRLSSPSTTGPIRGRAGISYAAALLRHAADSLRSPADPPSIRWVATDAGMSPSGIGEAAKRLRDVGLVRPDGRPTEELFWELATVWQPARATPVGTRPDLDVLAHLDLRLEDLGAPGWAEGGDTAALAWGAPMFTVGDVPWIWAPSHALARRADRLLGPAGWDDRAGVIAVPPTPLVCQDRLLPPDRPSPWPTPHPVYLALELAQDPGRGREILEGWNPERFNRVW